LAQMYGLAVEFFIVVIVLVVPLVLER